MNLTSLLLEFLMNLLRSPEAAAKFQADPEGELEKAGLSEVECDHVDQVMPVILDKAVIGDREYNTGGNWTHGGDADTDVSSGGGHNGGGHNGGHGGGGHGGGGHNGGGHGGGGHNGGGHGGGGDHAHAVQQIHHVVNNYSYTEVDDRDTITDLSTNQNIWANGDVLQVFDNDAIVNSGDHGVAAGGDATVDNSADTTTTTTTTVTLEAGEDLIIGDNNDENNVTAEGDVAVDSTNSANDVSFDNVGNDYSNNSTNTTVTDSEDVNVGENNSADDVDLDFTKINAEDSAVATDGGEAAYVDASTEFDDITVIDADQSVVAVEDGPGDAEAEAEAEVKIEESLVFVADPLAP